MKCQDDATSFLFHGGMSFGINGDDWSRIVRWHTRRGFEVVQSFVGVVGPSVCVTRVTW